MTLQAYFWRSVAMGAVVPVGVTLILPWLSPAGSALICGVIWLVALAGFAVWFDRKVLGQVARLSARAEAVSRGQASAASAPSSIDELATLEKSLTRAEGGLRAAVRLLDAQ